MAFAKPPVRSSEDFRRVRALPVRGEEFYPADLVHKLTDILKTPDGTQTLRDVQARALYDAAQSGRGFFPIRVGGGKTLITFLLPVVLRSKRPLLVVPASLLEKTERDWRTAMKDWKVAKHLVFKSYEWLSQVKNAGYLAFYKPDLLLADEASRIKNPKAAVTRRFRRCMEETPNPPRFMPFSGTIMKSSVKDFAHLMRWSHGEMSVLPHLKAELDAWAGALDEGLNPAARRSAGVLLDLFPEPSVSEPPPAPSGEWDHMIADADNVTENEARRARRIFFARSNATVGIISADAKDDYTGSLLIEALEYTPNAATEANFKKLRETMCKPDGWALADAMQVWAEARRLALGLHYTWFDEGRFQQCLTQTSRRDNGSNGSIEQRILNVCARTIASVDGLRRVLEVQKTGAGTGSSSSTVSLPQITPRSLQSLMGSTTSASGIGRDVVDISTLITIIEREKFEDFCATRAIKPWELWATLLKEFPGLLTTLQAAYSEANPPEAWLQARKLWAKFVRDVLADPWSSERGWDSELQVMTAVLHGDLGDPFDLLGEWRRIKDTFTINPKPVWHDDTALKVCEQWLATHDRGICWVEHRFFGAELSRRTGLSYFGPKGLDAQERFVEDASGPIIASIAANSTGRNLQHKWDSNLITAPAADSERWEQLMARTHRPGQKSDSVTVDVLVGCREHLESLPRAVRSAGVKADLLGFSQKLKLADIVWPDVRGGVGPRFS